MTPTAPAAASNVTPDVDTEAEAVRAALAGELLPRLRIATRALNRLMRDPEDTRQVFLLYVSLNATSFPRVIKRFLAEPEGRRLMTERPALDSTTLDFAQLLSLPAHTLGHAFARHMADNGLSPDIFQAPPGAPPDVAYLAQRLRQTHDLWHVVTGYSTGVIDELALQAFTYAQMKAPGPLLLSLAGALRFGFGDRRAIQRIYQGYRRGLLARPMLAVAWESLWELPLAEVRARLNL